MDWPDTGRWKPLLVKQMIQFLHHVQFLKRSSSWFTVFPSSAVVSCVYRTLHDCSNIWGKLHKTSLIHRKIWCFCWFQSTKRVAWPLSAVGFVSVLMEGWRGGHSVKKTISLTFTKVTSTEQFWLFTKNLHVVPNHSLEQSANCDCNCSTPLPWKKVKVAPYCTIHLWQQSELLHNFNPRQLGSVRFRMGTRKTASNCTALSWKEWKLGIMCMSEGLLHRCW